MTRSLYNYLFFVGVACITSLTFVQHPFTMSHHLVHDIERPQTTNPRIRHVGWPIRQVGWSALVDALCLAGQPRYHVLF